MFSDLELEQLLDDEESDLVERKASASDREEIKKTICAFANDFADHRKPGVILIGVNKDGSCAGLSKDDALQRLVAGFRAEGNLLPLPSMRVEWRTIRGCHVLVVQVEPSPLPPVRLRGRSWIRVGSTLQTASPEEERRLTEKRLWRNLPFDQTPVTPASVRDLNLTLFAEEYLPAAVDREVITDNQRSPEQQLAAMRFLTVEGAPTVAGMLVLGQDPRRWLPGAYVQFTRFAGTDLTAPVRHQKELGGPLSRLIRLVEETLTINIQASSEIVGHEREERRPDYPIEALRQLVRNSVMHRSYEATNAPVRLYWFSDRVEIQNPGGPFGQVNRENFGRPGITDYRNPEIAEAMKVLGYVQRFGAGLPIARRELQKNGNPPPEFEVESAHVLAIVRRRQ